MNELLPKTARAALLTESEQMDSELHWLGMMCDWIGKLEYVEPLPDMISGVGAYMRRYFFRRLAIESYFLGRELGDYEDYPDIKAEWARLRARYPETDTATVPVRVET